MWIDLFSVHDLLSQNYFPHGSYTPDHQMLNGKKGASGVTSCDFIGTTAQLPKKSSENPVEISTPAQSRQVPHFTEAASVLTCSPIETPVRDDRGFCPTA
jgi:hypothetical protein